MSTVSSTNSKTKQTVAKPQIGVSMSDVFVFGSNLAGRHGKGTALTARQHHGAIYGQGVGLQGSSYGIPTKSANLTVLPIHTIRYFVNQFIKFAVANPELKFNVTKIGCGLAGYTPAQIAPLFTKAIDVHNIILPW